ncbi:MAG: preprotein translocase subunit YajC [Lentisphaerae bacterium]|nr:preprotein translocase subunit YajC [Lentisphaerota bacterium]
MANMFPLLIIVVMIFILFRANKKQQRQRQEMLNKIVKGSKVMLNSGVMGKVSEVREHEFLVEIAENVKVLVIRDGVTLIEEKNEEKK